MNKEEVKRKFQELLNIIPENFRVFVFINDTESHNSCHIGAGCAACEVEDIIRLYIDNKFKHNSEEEMNLVRPPNPSVN